MSKLNILETNFRVLNIHVFVFFMVFYPHSQVYLKTRFGGVLGGLQISQIKTNEIQPLLGRFIYYAL